VPSTVSITSAPTVPSGRASFGQNTRLGIVSEISRSNYKTIEAVQPRSNYKIIDATELIQQSFRPASPSPSRTASPSPSRSTAGSANVVRPPNTYRPTASCRLEAPRAKMSCRLEVHTTNAYEPAVSSRPTSVTRSPVVLGSSDLLTASSRTVMRSRSLTPTPSRSPSRTPSRGPSRTPKELRNLPSVRSSVVQLSPQRDFPSVTLHLATSSQASSPTRYGGSADLSNGATRSEASPGPVTRGGYFDDIPITGILSPARGSTAARPIQAAASLSGGSKSSQRSVSPHRISTSTPDLANATATARERARPFRRLVSHSIGLGAL
jgi:hypothetical protein